MRVRTNFRPSPTAAVVQLLQKSLNVPVSAVVPAERPKRFVTVQRTGGSMRNPVTDRAQMAIQCWAESAPEAEQMCFDAEAALAAVVCRTFNGMVIRHFQEVTAPLAFPDESGHPRFQVFVELDFIVH